LKFRKTKIKPLISIKLRFLIKIVINYFIILRFFEKEVFGGYKSQIFSIGDQNTGRGDRMGRLGDVATYFRRFWGAWRSFYKSGGWEVIFAGLMSILHPLPK